MGKKYSRRSVFRGAGALGAAALASKLFGRRALASGAAGTPAYFLLTIQLRGGLHPQLMFDYQDRALHSCDIGAGDTSQTPGGIVWNSANLASAIGNHVADMTLIRNVQCDSLFNHEPQIGELWFGTSNINQAAQEMPWTNYLASKLVDNRPILAPNLVATWGNGSELLDNYLLHTNPSPNPLGAMQYVSTVESLLTSLDTQTGLPNSMLQQRVYDYIAGRDATRYSPVVQPSLVNGFEQANAQASALLGTSPTNIWAFPGETPTPEFMQLISDFGLDDPMPRWNEQVSTGPNFESALLLAYQMFRYGLGGCMTVSNEDLVYDTHISPLPYYNTTQTQQQNNAAARHFAAIGTLLTKLKNTVSPFDASCSLYDHTVVFVTSEMGRAPTADPNGGTPHWPWSQAYIWGGPFRRDAAFGATNDILEGVPANFSTGALNEGQVPTFKNVFGTVIAAMGFDPVPDLGMDYQPIGWLIS